MCAALLQQYYSVEWSGKRCSLWGYYWIGCPSVAPGLCPNVCSLTVPFVPFLLCLADAILNAWCVFHQYRNFTQSKWSPVLAGCYQSKISFSFIYLVLSQLHNQSSYLFINTWAILHIYPCAYALYVLPLNIEMCCGLFSHTMYIHTSECQHPQVEEEKCQMADNILSSCLFSTNHAEILSS